MAVAYVRPMAVYRPVRGCNIFLCSLASLWTGFAGR